MLLEPLLTASLCAEALEVVQTVLGSLALLLSVVNGLLDFRSIQQGTFTPKRDLFSPAKVFKLAIDMFRQEAAATGITLHLTVVQCEEFAAARSPACIAVTPTESTTDLPAFLQGDRTRL